MRQYNSKIHHRRSIRLRGYDYSQKGAYFITICCQYKICRFGNITNEEMEINSLGQIAYKEWFKLPKRFPNIELDIFQIMPNHIHAIIILNQPTVVAGFTPAQPDDKAVAGFTPAQPDDEKNTPAQNGNAVRANARVAPTIGDIVGAYKSLVAKGCLGIFKSKNEIMGKLWQRNYWEHIIRNKQAYQNISNYILNNPKNWEKDKLYQ